MKKEMQDKATEMFGTMKELGKNMWFVGLGALATVEDKGTEMFNGLKEKGEKFEGREKTFVDKTVKQATEQFKTMSKKVETGVKDGTQLVLNRFGIPTHDQIQDLIARVDKLNTKVDKIGA